MTEQPNRIRRVEPLRGQRAYMYGFRARAQRHHCPGYGTFPVEVEQLRRLRKEYTRRVAPITNLPIYVKAVALAVQRNPEANAILFRSWFGHRIVHFERVDVSLPITRQVGDRWITFLATVRDAASKPLVRIQEEITTHQRCPPDESFAIQRFLKIESLPGWVSALIHWRFRHSPAFYLRNGGTCGLTLAEESDLGDHFFPVAPSSVVFGLGGARREPVVRGDQISIARLLKCVLMIDNFVIPGLLGAKLAKDFKELLETGRFITEEIGPVAEAARVP